MFFVFFVFIISLLTGAVLHGEESQDEIYHPGITVHLRSPTYSEGVLSTCSGGVIEGPDLRIQASSIDYTRKMEGDQPISTIVASGDLMLEFGMYVFVGERLEYDFQSRTGIIYNGRTMVEPWFFGGATIYLYADGSYFLESAFVTTSDNVIADWEILADSVEVSEDRYIQAKDVTFNIFRLPVFWIPSLYADLNSIFDSPISYNVKWGGNQGHRFGLVYEVFSWERIKTFLRLEYRLKRGLGGGIRVVYTSPDRRISFDSSSYAAYDSPIIHPRQMFRYRYQGVGDASLMDDRTTVHLSYDKVSDIDMPTDYNDIGLKLATAGRTELVVRHERETMISNLLTHLRVNSFQTVKEELPTFTTSWLPFDLGPTGIISDIRLKASYLDLSYGTNQVNVHDYHSSRFEFSPTFYRHLAVAQVNITPEVGGTLIAYGNSPQHDSKCLVFSKLGCNLNTELWRCYNRFKHVITPYVDYSYYTMPTVLPGEHYIFDIDDGWYRLNIMRFGASQGLYFKRSDGSVKRQIYADIYANVFFDNDTFPQAIPKGYANFRFNTFPNFYHSLNTGWDFMHHEVDHFNIRTEWTYSADIAVAAEYRHRSRYDWRKGDRTNFILDAFRTIRQLKDSQVSDRRDTFLFHCFVRFHPSWAIEVESRHGWNRLYEPPYTEYEIDLLGTLRSAWNMRLSYQHREDDERVSVYFSIGIKRPDGKAPDLFVPCLGF